MQYRVFNILESDVCNMHCHSQCVGVCCVYYNMYRNPTILKNDVCKYAITLSEHVCSDIACIVVMNQFQSVQS